VEWRARNKVVPQEQIVRPIPDMTVGDHSGAINIEQLREHIGRGPFRFPAVIQSQTMRLNVVINANPTP